MIINMKGKNDFGVETLKFSDADHFEMVDTFNQSKLVRQKD